MIQNINSIINMRYYLRINANILKSFKYELFQKTNGFIILYLTQITHCFVTMGIFLDLKISKLKTEVKDKVYKSH